MPCSRWNRRCGRSVRIWSGGGFAVRTVPRDRAATAAPAIGVEDGELHAVVVPVGDDRIRVAGTAELAGLPDCGQAAGIEFSGLRDCAFQVAP
jgi:hypothetical protein